MPEKKQPTATIEEYLEAMLNMVSEGRSIVAARLAERLGVSAPTVALTLRRMRRDELIAIGKNREIHLTERGLKLSIQMVRRHRLAECLLTDVLKIPWHEVHEEACLLEHCITEKVEASLYQALGKPTTCPHGNPIPVGDELPPCRGVPLDTILAGQTVVVERISDEANQLIELMKYLHDTGIKPGATLTVEDVAHYAGTMRVGLGDREISLGTKAAAMVLVAPTGDSG